MLDDKLAIGIIGIGWWGAFAHVPSLRDTGRAEVVAISRRNPERLALAARELGIARTFTDWREMLERESARPDPVDLVTVATPNATHFEIAKAFLEAGFNVLCEKPMATTVAGEDPDSAANSMQANTPVEVRLGFNTETAADQIILQGTANASGALTLTGTADELAEQRRQWQVVNDTLRGTPFLSFQMILQGI